MRSLRSPNAPSPTGSSDNSLDVSSSSQQLVASSSRTLSYCASPAQPSLASCVQPHTDRLQAYTSAQRVLPVAKESQAHQAPPLQSLQASAPSNSHQTRCEPPPHPVAAPPPPSNGKEIRRDPRCHVGLEETIRTAGPATSLNPHQLSSKALPVASSTISSKPLAPPDSGRSRQPLVLPPVYLTSDVCARLKDHADDAVLSTFPVLRVLVLRSVGPANGGTATKSHEVFLTDGHEYVWLAFTSSAAESFGDRDDRKSLQVGSAVRLKRMSRLPSADLCPILIHDIEIIDGISDARSAAAVDAHQPNSAIRPEISWSPGARPTVAPSPRAFNDRPPDGTPIHNERAALLLADAKFQEERRRRILLERALADVCGDLHRLDNLYPAAAEALRRIDRLADAAMSTPG
ncbi:hypothetical protein LXA43DRAFT_20866 [Ganoderma leucocontextum]|nr:hypothetical protein LXA43DRAFT_20866 [Ganoderma leucocontextum]